jgi:hypothetical protein
MTRRIGMSLRDVSPGIDLVLLLDLAVVLGLFHAGDIRLYHYSKAMLELARSLLSNEDEGSGLLVSDLKEK